MQFLRYDYFKAYTSFEKRQDIRQDLMLTEEQVGDKQVIVISHLWETIETPDPTRMQFQSVRKLLEEIKECVVFYDYSCLFQKPRTSEQEMIFQSNLRSMRRLYSGKMFKNTNVHCVYFTENFSKRAWPFFEWSLSTIAGVNINVKLMKTSAGNLIRAFINFKKLVKEIRMIEGGKSGLSDIIKSIKDEFTRIEPKFSDRNKMMIMILSKFIEQLDENETRAIIINKTKEILGLSQMNDLRMAMLGMRYNENIVDNKVRDDFVHFLDQVTINYDELRVVESQRKQMLGEFIRVESEMFNTLTEVGYETPRLDDFVKDELKEVSFLKVKMEEHYNMFKRIIIHSLVLELKFCSVTEHHDTMELQSMLKTELESME